MAWMVHKPADCLLAKQPKEEQKKKPQKAVANSTTFAAAVATAVNPQFATLMALITNLDKGWCTPAWMWMFTMLAFMAEPTMHIGHQVTYL
jgi:hypothetical protein